MSKKHVLDSWSAVSIDSLFDGRTFDEVILDLQTMLRRYDEEIYVYDKKVWFETVYNGYDGGVELYVRVDRLETDNEYEQRQTREQAKKDKAKRARETKKAKALAVAVASEEDERALFEKLKAKFGE